MKRAVFLDRDGVLNRSVVRAGRPYAPTSLEEFELLPGVLEALTDLRTAGFVLVVVTNQPDLATGRIRPEVAEAIHQKLRALLPIDDIRVCGHVDGDGPGRLVGVEQDQRADPVGALHHRGDVEQGGGAEGDVGDGDQGGALVDRLDQALLVDGEVAGGDDLDLGAEGLLRPVQVVAGGELQVGGDQAVPRLGGPDRQRRAGFPFP